MSNNSPRWEPGGNAVHRLIQLLDVLAIAFNRFRQCSFPLPTYNPPQPFDTEGWQAGVSRLRAEFDAVRTAICAGYVSPARRAERIADEAIAEFACVGGRDDGTVAVVADAARWLGYVGTPWEVGTPRPWDYGTCDPHNLEGYEARRRGEERFDRECELLFQYSSLRRALLSALARTGKIVPPEIDRRTLLAHHTWPEGGSAPITQEELLALVREAEPTANDTPPLPTDPYPATPAMTTPHDSPSPFARLVQSEAERRQCEAVASAEHAERMRCLQAFRACWNGAWSRLLNAFDAPAQYRLTDAEAAASALAEVGALLVRLAEVRTEMQNDTAAARLESNCDHRGWWGRGAPTAAALLLEAVRGASAPDLTRMLARAEADESLRVAFGWLEFYRDRFLPQPGTRNRAGFLETAEAMPAVQYHVDDLRFAEAQLTGWRNVAGVRVALAAELARVDPQEEQERTVRDCNSPSQPDPCEPEPNPASGKRGGPASRQQRDGAAQDEQREPDLNILPERARIAYAQYFQAERALVAENGVSATDVTDDAAHSHLKTDGVELPTLDTWTRYLREARNALGQQKKKPRRKYVGRSAAPPEHFGDRGDD